MAEGEQNMHSHIRWRNTIEETATAQHSNRDDNTDASASQSGNVLYRLTANPQKVKTQVAKISYGSPRIRNIKTAKTTKSSVTTMRHVDSPIISPLPQSARLPETATQEAFAKRKAEREKEIQEMQNMLSELAIAKSPRKSEKDLETVATVPLTAPVRENNEIEMIPSSNLTYRKSRSDLHLERAHSQTGRESCWSHSSNHYKPRSRSSQPLKTKSDLDSGNRVKSYNPEDARRYMEEQKKRRRSNPAKFDAILHPEREKSQRDKEQIRKNLEELRKNTRKILSKSVRKKEIGNTESSRSQKESHGGIVFKKPPERNQSCERNANSKDNNTERVNKRNHNPIENDVQQKNLNMQKTDATKNITSQESQLVQSSAKSKSNDVFNPLTENQKRVGILRKPDVKDHSFSAIKEYSFDKENVAIDMMTPKLTGALESRVKEPPLHIDDENLENIVVEPLKKEKVPYHEKCTQVKENVSLMEVADAKNATKSTQQASTDKRPDLPYWLRPSAVQVYPYNFIVAVRRKLEAAVNASQPIDAPDLAKPLTNEENGMLRKHKSFPTNFVERTVMTTTKAGGQENLASERRLVNERLHKIGDHNNFDQYQGSHRSLRLDVAIEEPIIASQENLIKSNSITDFSSNFSSISLQLPTSDGSSIHSVNQPSLQVKPKSISPSKPQPAHDDDDTTVSSSILNSPEKKPISRNENGTAYELGYVTPHCVSPLSLEKVDSLKLVTKSKSKEALISTYNAESDKSISQNISKVESKSLADNEISLNFNKFLDEFQRSLTQVIEVNEQLKSTIDKSTSVVSPKQNSKSITLNRQHIEVIVTAAEGNKEELSNKENILYSSDFEGSSSRKSSERIDKSEKELIDKISQKIQTASTKSNASSVYRSKSEKGIPSFDLNLKSITNSSANSTDDEMLSTQNHSAKQKLDDSANEQRYESHLHNIEVVKEKLRRSIMDSRANRLADGSLSIRSDNENISHKSQRNQTPTSWNGSARIHSKSHSFSGHEISTHASSNDKQSSSAQQIQTRSPVQISQHEDTLQPMSESQHSMQKSIYTNSKSIPEDVKENSFEVIYKAHHKNNDSSNASENLPSTKAAKRAQSKKDKAKLAHIKSHINGSRGDFFVDSLRDANMTIEQRKGNSSEQDEVMESDGSQTSSTVPLPSYKTMTPKLSKSQRKDSITSHITAHTIGEIVAVFKQPDCDLSFVSVSNASISESSISYSNVGLYDKLIQNETSKSEKLTTLLKMREKALLDRTKGQIAWLQVQKERFKAKGLMTQIAAIKKKQRAILMKMAKEREEIKRLLQTSSSTLSTESLNHQLQLPSGSASGSSPKKYLKRSRYGSMKPAGTLLPFKSAPPALPALPLGKPSKIQRSKSQRQQIKQEEGVEQEQHNQHSVTVAVTRSAPILRASYDLETSAPLEKLLERREADLRRRREHVERLMEWHRRLDQEEAEVMHMEHIILNYNRKPITPNSHSSQSNSSPSQKNQIKPEAEETIAPANGNIEDNLMTLSQRSLPHRLKMERRIREIDQSLRELGNISASSQSQRTGENSDTSIEDANVDYIPITGHKLNKLWRRLTSQHIEKFEPNRRYKLCKSDLERLYEEAKKAVLKDFAQDEERITMELLERSGSNLSTSTNISQPNANTQEASDGTLSPNRTIVPRLRLNISSEASEPDEESLAEASARSLPHGNYSPSAAESDFHLNIATQPSFTPPPPDALLEANCNIKGKSVQNKLNMKKFMELSRHYASQSIDLQRSQSDTNLPLIQLNISDSKIGTSHGNIMDTTINDEIYFDKSQNAQKEMNAADVSLSSPGADTLHSVQSIKSSYSQSFSNSVESTGMEQATNIPIEEPNQYNQISKNFKSLIKDQDEKGDQNYEVPSRPLDLTVKCGSLIQTANPPSTLATEISEQTSLVPDSEIQTQTSESPLYTEFEPTEVNSSKTLINENIEESPNAQLEHSAVDSIPSETMVDPVTEDDAEDDVDRRAREITARLEEISSAVLLLSQLSAASNEMESNLSFNNEIAGTSTANVDEEVSYSSKFEQLTSEWEAFKSQTTAALEAEGANLDRISEDATEIDTTPEAAAIKSVFDKYESDFESSSNETQIVDITVPDFENTLEVSQDEENPDKSEPNTEQVSAIVEQQNESKTVEVADVPLPPPPEPPAASNSGGQHMPDIINELETRRQQNLFEAEQARQYEHVTAVPYMYVREIPNKPPPPYVPPAHGSPMTTIFPSKERIKDITYRRTHELYCEILKTDYINENGEKLPSVMEEKITNIYERIILDICREYLKEHQDVLMQGGDPANFHSQLAFFNPPDRLLCIQESIYKEVRRCLGMDKPSPKRGNSFSVYGNRSKRDQIGRIIIQEMYEEEDSWCNFPNEEQEVLEMIFDEMIRNEVAEIAKQTLLEAGGTIDDGENACEDGEIISEVITNSEPVDATIDDQPEEPSESHTEQE